MSNGMSEKGAREFHRLFMMSFIIFTIIAIIAHFLVWQWRPWFPSVEGYSAVLDGLNAVSNSVLSHIT